MRLKSAILMLAGLAAAAAAAPGHLYLTWQGDTATTMTINFHTPGPAPSRVHYDTLAHGGRRAEYAFAAEGTWRNVPGMGSRWVHGVELRSLRPATTYYASVAEGHEIKFRTGPADSAAVRFVVGGDTGVGPAVGPLMARAAAQEPLFAVVGGDLAYADGRPDNAGLWDEWLGLWCRNMVTPAGYTVPLVAVIGNHEVDGGYGGRVEDAPFYMGLFAQNGDTTYYSRTFGRYLALVVLDSGHLVAHADQIEWLEGVLARHAAFPYRLAAYHVPLYPGYRHHEGEYARLGRAHWEPLFDRHHLTAAFEHHDHTLKRSKRLRGGRPDSDGTLYLGDGCMGRMPRVIETLRPVDRRRRWYIDHSAGQGHVWLVEADGVGMRFSALGADGRVLDATAVGRPAD